MFPGCTYRQWGVKKYLLTTVKIQAKERTL